jgi:putative restriction endonuclease
VTPPDPLAPFRALRQHGSRAKRAPHKPLVLLWTLARLLRGESRLAHWAVLREPIEALLRDFGRPGQPLNPHYPFWRLLRDGIWQVDQREQLATTANASGDILVSALNELNPNAGFAPALWAALHADPQIAFRAAQVLLDDNFPPTLHEDILLAVGMPQPEAVGEADTTTTTTTRRRRDPAFRATILRIYEHRCAVCGYQGRLGPRDLGLEAAHVRWHTHDGPDREENGLALCSFHHRIFDSGAITLDDDRTVLVSQDVHGAAEVNRLILNYHGAPLIGPQRGAPPVAVDHAQWHRAEVFRRPSRARLPERHPD